MRPEPRLIPFEAAHALAIDNRDLETHGIEFARAKEAGGPAWTALLPDGAILCCGGFVIPWPGMGIVWLSASKEIAHYGLWLTKVVRFLVREQMGRYHLHRLEAVILKDEPRNSRWIEAMGFRSEGGVAHQYTSDRRDCLRYELVRNP
jgi:hypothetical protein